jgi:hypothetical protein
MWFKREAPKGKGNYSIVTDKYASENWYLLKLVAILVLTAKCINPARI